MSGVEASPPLVSASQLTKSYGAVRALRGVDLRLRPGIVHALLGANGAGKSTVVRILAGAEHADGGQLVIDDVDVASSLTPSMARQLGLRFIHQDPQLVPKLTGVQNLLLNEPIPRRGPLISWGRAKRAVQEAAERAGVNFDLEIPAGKLSLPQQWILAVARALVGRARLVVMDEPTASLPAEASAQVYRVVRDLASQGVAVLYITHRLGEVVDLADEVTVMRDGRETMSLRRGAFDVDVLIKAIVGSELEQRKPRSGRSTGAPLLEVRHLSRPPSVRNVSFGIARGEIVGLGGLVGSGRTEIARMIFGADTPDSGSMVLDGKAYVPDSPSQAIRRGVALVPEERRSQGLVLNASVAANVALPAWKTFRVRRDVPLLRMRSVTREGEDVVKRLGVKTSSVVSAVRTLSGGNQQKVLIGRWLRMPVELLILDEPTRGVDVGARNEIHRIARAFAESGHAVLMISSELEELEVCDRVLVIREGEVVEEILAPHISEASILAHCYPEERVN
jgi:ribose transport system ATP-binding protein